MSSKLALPATCLSLVLLLASRCTSQEAYGEARRQMVEQHLKGRDIRDRRVLEAMGKVPRHEFVPLALRSRAYADHALPIGEGQTISQPYIVALMTQLAELSGTDVVLEVGPGYGVLTERLVARAGHVHAIERRYWPRSRHTFIPSRSSRNSHIRRSAASPSSATTM